jgi:hypothetical protein
MIEPRLAGIYQRFNWPFPVLAARQRGCLKRVIRVISSVRQPLPVCPQLRTLATRRGAVVWPDERAKGNNPPGPMVSTIDVDGHLARHAEGNTVTIDSFL